MEKPWRKRKKKEKEKKSGRGGAEGEGKLVAVRQGCVCTLSPFVNVSTRRKKGTVGLVNVNIESRVAFFLLLLPF